MAGNSVSGAASHGPLLLGLVVCAVVITASVTAAVALTGGHLVYSLDDAYIHMAMARTLAESGGWGISPDQPSFASSSPGWTLLLAVLAWLGVLGDWTPLVLNVVAAVVVLWVADAASARLLVTARARSWLLVSLVFVTPMPALVLSGMEALWQIAAVLAFVSAVTHVAANATTIGWRTHLRVAVIAAAMVAFRYESLFVAAGGLVVLVARRRAGLAATVTAASLLAPAAYAAYSVTHGGWWLPASVMLKGQVPALGAAHGTITFLADKGFPALFTHWPLPPLVVTTLALLLVLSFRNPSLAGEAESWLVVAVCAVLLHVHLVNFEWMFRYRAYLVVLCTAASAFGLSRASLLLGIGASELRTPLSRRLVALALAATLAGPLVTLSIEALGRGPRGCRSVYLQQYQVARFLAGTGVEPVAVNDIGAVAYFTRRAVVDLQGLANQPIAVSRRSGAFDTAQIDEVTRAAGVELAVIYEAWFEGPLAPPAGWTRVARWTAAESVSIARPTVALFAVRPGSAGRLRRSLEAWQPRLPAGVAVVYD